MTENIRSTRPLTYPRYRHQCNQNYIMKPTKIIRWGKPVMINTVYLSHLASYSSTWFVSLLEAFSRVAT